MDHGAVDTGGESGFGRHLLVTEVGQMLGAAPRTVNGTVTVRRIKGSGQKP